jgi:hypothetical protein
MAQLRHQHRPIVGECDGFRESLLLGADITQVANDLSLGFP